MAITELDTSNFDQLVLQAERPVLVDFWAAWCGPCRAMSPVMEEIAQVRKDIDVYKCNVDLVGTIARKYNITSIPTRILFRDGKPTATIISAEPKQSILAKLAKHLAY